MYTIIHNNFQLHKFIVSYKNLILTQQSWICVVIKKNIDTNVRVRSIRCWTFRQPILLEPRSLQTGARKQGMSRRAHTTTRCRRVSHNILLSPKKRSKETCGSKLIFCQNRWSPRPFVVSVPAVKYPSYNARLENSWTPAHWTNFYLLLARTIFEVNLSLFLGKYDFIAFALSYKKVARTS